MLRSRRVRSWWPLLLIVAVGGCAWNGSAPSASSASALARATATPSTLATSVAAAMTATPPSAAAPVAEATVPPGAIAATCLPFPHQQVIGLGWSPDGSALAAVTKPDFGYDLNGSSLAQGITLIAYPSLTETRVYAGDDLISGAALGADNRTVYFVGGRSTGNGIWAVEAGGTPRLLLATAATDAEAGLTATPRGLVRDVVIMTTLTDPTSWRHTFTFVDWKGNARSLGGPYPGLVAWVSADAQWVMTSTTSQSATIWHGGSMYLQVPLQAGFAIGMDHSQTGLFTIVGNASESAFDITLVQLTGAAGWSYPIASTLTKITKYALSPRDVLAYGGEGALCFLNLGI